MQVDNVNAITKRIAKRTAEPRIEFQLVLAHNLLPYLLDLCLIAHHHSKMPGARWTQLIDFRDGEKLVLAELKKGATLTAGVQSETEHILIERDCFLQIVDLNRYVVATINLNAHSFLFVRTSAVG